MFVWRLMVMIIQCVTRRRSVARRKRLEWLQKASKRGIDSYTRLRRRKAQTAFQQLFFEGCKPKTVSRSIWIGPKSSVGGTTSLRMCMRMRLGKANPGSPQVCVYITLWPNQPKFAPGLRLHYTLTKLAQVRPRFAFTLHFDQTNPGSPQVCVYTTLWPNQPRFAPGLRLHYTLTKPTQVRPRFAIRVSFNLGWTRASLYSVNRALFYRSKSSQF